MKKILQFSLLLSLSLHTLGCNDMLDENVDPDKPHSIDAKVGLPSIVFANAHNGWKEFGRRLLL